MIILRDLDVRFGAGAHATHAVKELSLSFGSGVAYGLVGESGCGKTTVLRAIAGLIPNWTGQIEIAGQLQEKTRDKAFYRKVQMVFQDPYGSLSPRLSVGQIVEEGLLVHEGAGDYETRRRVISDALAEVGIDPATQDRYPHEFSGGQRQRIAIARAMVLKPKFVVLDEPTSALDMSVQAQIVDLLRDLQRRHNLAYLFISHDLKVVRALADEVVVMRAGRVVEQGTAEQIFDSPREPYTRALIAAAFELEAVEQDAVST